MMTGLLNYLDPREPLLREMADKVFPGEDLDLQSQSTFCKSGSILRNFIMAHRAFTAAAHHQAVDMVIGTGDDHLGKGDDIAYAHALPAALLGEAAKRGETNTKVMSLFPASRSDGYLPHHIIPPGREDGHIPVIVHGLAEDEHMSMWCYPDDYLDTLAQSFHRAGQFRHLGATALKRHEPEYEDLIGPKL